MKEIWELGVQTRQSVNIDFCIPNASDFWRDEMEKPEMINWRKYNVRDNGQDILDMKLKWCFRDDWSV